MIAATPSVCCCCIDGPEELEAADEESAGDVVELPAIPIEAGEGFETLPVAEVRLFSSEPIDSSRCHLELRAALI